VRSLTQALAAGRRWDIVFNIAEGLRGVAREAQVPALLDAYEIAYTFSDPLVLSLTLHKGMTKRVLRDLGLPTTDFREVHSVADVASIDLPLPLFIKPIAEGTGKGIDGRSKVSDRSELDAACRRLLERYDQPVLVEPFLPGREFTVGMLGTGAESVALGTLEVRLLAGAEADAYSFVNKERCEELVEYVLCREPDARRCEAIALAAWRGLGCRDAGRVDLRLDAAGRPQILELNPLAGIHPEHSDLPILCTKLGIPYRELIRRIMDSAGKRINRRRLNVGGATARDASTPAPSCATGH
jgi:D-alanine-D-alanine ligase